MQIRMTVDENVEGDFDHNCNGFCRRWIRVLIFNFNERLERC